VFHLKHRSTWAWGVAMNLEDFFKEEEPQGGRNDYASWWWGYPSTSTSSSPARLSKRRKLRFIPDSDSNTILVQGADAEQLKIIQELIDLYDQPESQESASLRVTDIFYLRHSKAKTIAAAIKDVYRDLLSVNDPALQQHRQQDDKQQPPAERSYTYIFGDAGERDKPDPPIRFKGLLSLGVDEVSNALIVSAPQGLLNEVGQMIDSLDEAARPSTNAFSFVPNGPGTGFGTANEELLQRLQRILGGKVRLVGPDSPVPPDSPDSPAVSRRNGPRFRVSHSGER
jgi:type II secretory pathway component GspD/PulD (secretin)